VLAGVLIGIGATLSIDLWSLFLRRAFDVRSLDYCQLGRWALHMPSGRVMHDSIAASARRAHECKVGWAAHYTIGVSFSIIFIAIVGQAWLEAPTVVPALTFGVATAVVPLFIMQPALGFGIASRRSPTPWQARLKSVGTHAVFGTGMYLVAKGLSLTF
jgi:hypothetical protein